MKILVAGATGKTGLRLINELSALGHTPIALVRASSDTSTLPADVSLRQGDLTDLHEGTCSGCDAVIFAAGSGGDTSAEMTDKVDRDGAMRLIDLAAKANVGRFVMLSTVGADKPDSNSELAHYLQAKHDADEHLKSSGLSYVIVRPVRLTDDDGKRDLRFGDDVDVNGEAARGDVAAVLATAVNNHDWSGQSFLMQSA
ncbi:SDR family oxidoreductase [Granulosicoccus antarcticus]|uniref:Putative sugar epimerase YhfK n=1 Tax=Granulosicoccus antarcticus IMCC3135 TaxID=1192854 RepID=A0A2Z2NTC9_9GAMM|nr:SDR family oxidoreductase [Granulosicoccus antarcticus]ASJ72988.1 putative sugar epimerase YhfK [Granulosicoccus antarcticus IMCC3135]